MTIQASIKLFDGMSPALKQMNHNLGAVINSFSSVQQLSARAVDPSAIRAAQGELTQVDTTLDRIGESVRQSNQRQRELNNSIRQGGTAADGLLSKLKGVAAAYLSIAGVRQAAGFVKDMLDFANVQNEAEAKMRTIMAQRMGAGGVEFQAVLDTTALEQSIGVVGDEMQLMGGQQLATFLNSTDALQTLIPAMNDLAVQQNGVNLTTENMTSIGNLMGKVMQGQTSALTRVGITFSEAQEQALKYGDEMERATVLAQVITDNVGQMNEAIRNTPAGQLAAIKNTFGDIKETIGNQLYPAVLHLFDVINTNMPTIQTVISGFAGGLSGVIHILAQLLEGAASVAQGIIENWSYIAPVILGVAGALLLYNSYLLISAAVEKISNIQKGLAAVADYARAAATNQAARATAAATAAQYGFNAALLACPLTWIVLAIAAVIVAVYAAVAAFNYFTGASVSATGIICGAVAVAAAVIANTVIGLLNGLLQLLWTVFVEPFIGIIEWVLNAANGGFDSFGGAVANLIGQIISWFLSLGTVVTKIIDAIFGSDWTSGLNALQGKVLAWGKSESAITLSRDAPEITSRFNYGDAWKAGNDFGRGLEDKVKGLFSTPEAGGIPDPTAGLPSAWEDLDNGVQDTAGNTGRMADAMEVSGEDLKYMRDIAERDAINQFTTAEIKVDMGGVNNNVSSTMDLDGVVHYLEEAIYESMTVAAEGVHL